ncbi:MAG: hypothetical protein HYY45_12150 [Deltaproteobacteria bacterium]|nr:hypothetical protein [Deltaproteobacteria bacterium]
MAFQFSSASYSVSESAATATIEVQRLGDMSGTVSVNFATILGTATVGVDFVGTSGTLAFGPGETTRAFGVGIISDTIPEPHETVNLALSNPQNPSGGATLGTPSAAVLRILNDDVAFRFSSATYSVSESGGQATITVRRMGALPPGVSVSVEYATVGGGTATAGTDYVATTGRLTFSPGQTTQSFDVTILDDLGPESHETVNMLLRDPVNPVGHAALATPDTAVLTILNDDVVFHFSQGAYVVREGDGIATIEVTRIGDTANDVSVDYATSDDTATAGSDYVPTSGTLTFTASDTTKSFEVTILNDGDREGNETAALALSNPSNPGGNARLGGPSTAMLMIIDDDPAVLGGGL